MAAEVDEQRQRDVAKYPYSHLVGLDSSCDNDAIAIIVQGVVEEEHRQSETISEDDNFVLEEQKCKKRRKSKCRRQEYIASEAKAPKLRPAADVLNRIQWDPMFGSEDFVIGYLERFEGIKEMPFDLWLRESTEEDFIPQHRIKYFKRIQSEEIVWSRDDRIDKIFRSGLGDGGLDK